MIFAPMMGNGTLKFIESSVKCIFSTMLVWFLPVLSNALQVMKMSLRFLEFLDKLLNVLLIIWKKIQSYLRTFLYKGFVFYDSFSLLCGYLQFVCTCFSKHSAMYNLFCIWLFLGTSSLLNSYSLSMFYM